MLSKISSFNLIYFQVLIKFNVGRSVAVLECHVCKYQRKSPYSLWAGVSGRSPACPVLSANEWCQCQLRGGGTLARCLANCASEPVSSRVVSGSLTYPECLTGHKVKWNEARVSLRRQDGIFKSSPVNSCLFICQLHAYRAFMAHWNAYDEAQVAEHWQYRHLCKQTQTRCINTM